MTWLLPFWRAFRRIYIWRVANEHRYFIYKLSINSHFMSGTRWGLDGRAIARVNYFSARAHRHHLLFKILLHVHSSEWSKEGTYWRGCFIGDVSFGWWLKYALIQLQNVNFKANAHGISLSSLTVLQCKRRCEQIWAFIHVSPPFGLRKCWMPFQGCGVVMCLSKQ